jgi:hypothetical protein
MTVNQRPEPPTDFDAYWPHYLGAHLNSTCRRMHYIGSTMALIFIGLATLQRQPGWLLAGLLSGYGCAWIGHFVAARNTPAAFSHPLWAFFGDWKMFALATCGRLGPHLERARALQTHLNKSQTTTS